jgi:hypothetical protein
MQIGKRDRRAGAALRRIQKTGHDREEAAATRQRICLMPTATADECKAEFLFRSQFDQAPTQRVHLLR